jgi:hypothetical protein
VSTPASREGRPAAAPRPFSWVLTAIVVGWLVVYNALRIAGDDPRRAAAVAIAPGVALGLLFFGGGLYVRRRLMRSGRMPARRAEAIGPEPLPAERRPILRAAAPVLGLAAIASIAVGVLLGGDWVRLAAADRSSTKLALALWDIVVGLWLGAELVHMLKGHVDGLESVSLGAVLTAVLAGVALSRSMFPPAQVILIVASGAAAIACQVVLQRVTGSRGASVGAALAGIVSVMALVIPLVS